MAWASRCVLPAVALMTSVLLASAPLAAQMTLPELDQCDLRVRDAPDDPASYYCYTQAAMRSGDIASSIMRVEQIYTRDRSRLRALLQIGVLEAIRGGERAGPLLLEAASRLEDAGDVWGEVYARSSLAQVLTRAGRLDAAQEVLDASAARARDAEQPVMRAHVLVDHARLALEEQDYGRALELYRRAGGIVLPSGPSYLRSWVLSGLGGAHWALGQRWAAIDSYLREVQLLEAQNNLREVAGPLYNIALMTAELYDAGEADEQQIVERLSTALDAARRGRNVELEASCRRLRAQVLGNDGGLEELDRAEELSAAIDDAAGIWEAGLLRATLLLSAHPGRRDEGLALLDRLLLEAREAGDLRRQGLALALRSRDARRRGDRKTALEAGLEAVKVIETLGKRQSGDGEIRWRTLGALSAVFDHLAGWLVASLPRSAHPGAELDLALSLSEKTRGRSLLTVGGEPPDGTPGIDQIRQALTPGEALVAYQGWPVSPRGSAEADGHPWALYVDQDRSFTFPIPVEQVLEDQVHTFLGLLDGEGPTSPLAAGKLFAELLGPAFEDGNRAMKRLVLVPDGPLHALPFSALIDSAKGDRLNLALSSAPSVNAWYAWRTGSSPAPDGRGVLSLAQPELAQARDGGFLREAGWWIDSVDLDSLDRARDEGSRLVARFGGQLLTGDRASETAIKSAPLSRYALLHFAAHALVSHIDPRRSAVLLAAGGADEDGLLRSEEIARLPLDGQVVLLSACEGAGGEIVEGEGVMGLARAFFVAGARAVVAPLRPIDDRSASAMISALGARLERGDSLDQALSNARAELRAAGGSSRGWSAWVVLGDGTRRTRGRVAGRTLARAAGGVLLLLAIGGLALLVRLRRVSAG